MFNMHALARGALIAALYVAITYALMPISFGPIQLRAAEALTVLPILYPEAIPGLFVGVFIANTMGGLGLADMVLGSLTTLAAAYATYRLRHSYLAYAPPIVFNAALVSLYLHVIAGIPYWLNVVSIGVSQSLVVLALGYPLVQYLKRRRG